MRAAAFAASVLLVAACAPRTDGIVSTTAGPLAPPDWAFSHSDIPVDPSYTFGRLDNGMRYVVRQNSTPRGTAIVRMVVRTGSLDESEAERGFAHFVEHMAFNGSTRVPEGEMVRLLERSGLAFGADTNASTSFDTTTYKLDLPVNDPALLDTALMLMRETASELAFDPDAVARERGVVLSEMRDRNDWQLRNALADTQFMHPRALYPQRFPIGTAETVGSASAQALRQFWAREYIPAHTSVFVIGDFNPAIVESAIRTHFSSWAARPGEKQPGGGPIVTADSGRTDIYIDPALANRITAERHGRWMDEPDSVATRQEKLLRQIGYGIVNRRLERRANEAEPPFRAAGYGTGDIFRTGRATRLVVDVIEKKWQPALTAAVTEYRRAIKFGFAEQEVAEQVANIRRSVENAAASAATRSNGVYEDAVTALLNDGIVPSEPALVLERFNAFAGRITPARVLKAMKREAVPLKDPLLRYRGRNPIDGGKPALRSAWNAAMRLPAERGAHLAGMTFGYSDFGTPGTIASDSVETGLGIRRIRFANGVMLNLKRSDIERDAVLVEVNVDGGDRLATRDNPLAVAMTRNFTDGGLGKHSEDDLRTILAGQTVQANMASDATSFVWNARTTPGDLDLQLALLAAFVTDPGYRPEGALQFRHYINNYFAQRLATPGSATTAGIGAILSDDDPRFSLGKVEDYRKLTFDKLRADIAGRLSSGAIEIAIVGDFDEGAAIAQVARTFGALPAREPEFGNNSGQPPRVFTQQRGLRIIRHEGPKDQGQLRFIWPTRDDGDARESAELELLERVMRIELTDSLRESLGKAYSPAASSFLSRAWPGYGTFAIAASVDVADIPATRAAIVAAVTALRNAPVDADILRRARQPAIESIDNALKSNAGLMSLVDRAQTEPDRIDRFLTSRERLLSLTAADVQAMAVRYLAPDAAVEIMVLPEGVDEPKG